MILDIRTREEYCSGHICGAINIETPLPPFTKKMIEDLFQKLSAIKIKHNEEIKVYCKKGIRSRKAEQILNYLGYKNVINLGALKETTLCYCESS
jgi:rhodanese-related sulfurtransferase